jgi:CheY-like chemotaxis protein
MAIPADRTVAGVEVRPPEILVDRPKRILVVDDDAAVRDVLVDLLSEQGYAVFAVADGGPALDVLDRIAVDLVLLDIVLKTVHGFEVLARLWSEPVLARIPVLIVSGFGTSLEPALRHKVRDVIQKPLAFPSFLATVQRTIAPPATGRQEHASFVVAGPRLSFPG